MDTPSSRARAASPLRTDAPAARRRPGTVAVGVIGFGYWGPNIVRNLRAQEQCEVQTICDVNLDALARAHKLYPDVTLTTEAAEVLTSPAIDAVAIVTPVWTHFDLARVALEHGKHVFVEKPFTASSAQAMELIELAARKGLQIMVDHTFLFSGAVRTIKELVDSGELGPLYYFDSTRINLGLFQHDVSVVWDLAPHDLSIMDFIIREAPEAVAATGGNHVSHLAEMAYITVFFPNRITAHINVNWLSPVKVRTTLIGGRDKMLVWNDLEPDEKIKVYDKGVEITTGQGVYDLLIGYRSGDVWAPKVDATEALARELRYFLDCVVNGVTPVNDGEAGLRVVRLLEAAERSLAARGQLVTL